MAGYSTVTTSTTSAELLQAYRHKEEEFYGLPEDEEVTDQLLPSDNSDEVECPSSDSEPNTMLYSFTDGDEVMIANQDVEQRDVRDHMQCG